MVLRSLSHLGFRASLGFRLLSNSSPILSSRFKTPDPIPPHLHPSDPQPAPNPAISEAFVIQELSDLLHIDPKISVPPNIPPDRYEADAPTSDDGPVTNHLLPPVDKLRGVFLQKLAGKFAIHSALSSTGVDLTPDIFAGVVNRGNLGGAAMVLFFDWAIKQRNLPHCVDTYNTMIKALGRRKFFQFMEAVLFRMKEEGVKPDAETVSIVLDSYVAARRVRKALEMFESLGEIYGLQDGESLAALLHSLCRWSHANLANSYMNKVKGKIPFDASIYNEIIGGWAKLGRIDEVERVLQLMVAEGLSPDSKTYANFIQALGRSGRTNDALIFFNELGEKGCPPNVVTYGAVILNFIETLDLDRVMELYKNMVDQNCIPDNELYAKLICAFLRVRRVADALELFDEMLIHGLQPQTEMITSFIKPLCKYGPPYAAMQIYRKSKKLGCVVSVQAYKLLLTRLSRLGKCGMVLKIWQEMQESGYPSDVEVYDCIVDGLCNAGKLDSAVLVVEESLQHGFCIGGIIHSKLSSKLLKRNKVETAYKLHLKVKEARRRANMQRIWRYKGWHF